MKAVRKQKPGQTNTDEIVESLRRAILEHKLIPGAKLSEDEVCAVFNVGRTIVRGVLQALAHENLVTIKRNRGAFVADPGVREAREVFEARALLEPRTAHSAALRATKKDVKTLRAHIAAEHAAIEAGDIGSAVYLSGLFHAAIADIADQSTIAAFIQSLVSRSSLIVALYWKRRNTLCESHAHHELIDAIANNDGPRAEALMQSHLVDLLSGLDLREKPTAPSSLKEALGSPSV